MSHSATHRHRRLRQQASLVFVIFCGVSLFAFYALHGINHADQFYAAEILVAWALALSGTYFGMRVYKRGSYGQRMAVAAALAVILSSLIIITLFSTYSDSPPGIPQPSDPAGNGA